MERKKIPKIKDRIVAHAAESKLGKFIDNVRYGWNNYSFIFYIGGISAILGKLFGLAGGLSVFVTVLFFYYIGKFQKDVDRKKGKKV